MTSHSALSPQPRPEILAIDPYVPGKSRVPGVAKVHKLSSNESPLGPSPKAIEAFRALAEQSCALSRRFSVDGPSGGDRPPLRSRSGANHLRQRLRRVAGAARACRFCTPATKASTANTAFSNIRFAFARPGGVPVVAKETDKTASVDAILAKVSARTKIVYLANPNNPTGTYIPFSEVKRLHAGLPPDTLLGDRRGLRRIRDPERLRRRPRARFDVARTS